MHYMHAARRVFNTPLLIHPAKGQVIADILGARMIAGPHAGAWDDESASRADSGRGSDPGYDLVGSTAIIPVTGTLVQKLGSLRPYSGMTGYDGIRTAFTAALANTQVKAIALDIDSPGGEVAGCFDLVDLIYGARGTKPVWSILSESAYSAAYAIASAADFITVPRTGGSGSVGVIWIHTDFSQQLTAQGIKATIVKYGDRKAEGNPYESLSPEVMASIQQDIDAMGELFVATVARNRDISPDAVRETQAATFMGQAGVDIKLADAVSPPDAAFQLLNQLTSEPT